MQSRSNATRVREMLLEGLDDKTLDLPPRRGRDLVKLMRQWDGRATEDSVGATATYAFLEAIIRHVFLDDLGELAFERYFEIMNVGPLPLLGALADDEGVWLKGLDRATIVRDAAAMAEGRLRRWRGEQPSLWTWGSCTLSLSDMRLLKCRDCVRCLRLGPTPRVAMGRLCAWANTTCVAGALQSALRRLRTVMFAGAPEEGGSVLPPGQSGDPSSKHYRDQGGALFGG